MSNRTWRFFAEHTAWNGFRLYLRKNKGDDVIGFTLETRTPGAPSKPSKPLFEDTQEDREDNVAEGMNFLRAALNCAWEIGLRPDGFNDTREGMAATKAHLEDMRALVFKTPKPGQKP